MSEVIYIGWGQKQTMNNYAPPFLPKLQAEFLDIELVETDDPTLAQEEAEREALVEKFEDDDALGIEEFEIVSMDGDGSIIKNVFE
jgi:hypothetical protein